VPELTDHHPTEIAVLIVAYNGRHFLEDCLSSVLASDDDGIIKRVVVVDNGSTDGTQDYLAETFPQVDCLSESENLGFAGGNNRGWDHIQQRYPNAAYVCLLNQDTKVASGWLTPLVRHLQQHPNVACVQSKLMLHPQTDRLNSAGNRSHFLGFGFVTGYGEVDAGQYSQPRSIDFASGAAMVVRAPVLRRFGLFDPMLFLYLEDVELGWKIRQAGLDVVFVPESVVYHKYTFKRDHPNYFFLERNRLWLLLVYFAAGTLVLLAPALLTMELGQLGFALRHGRLRDKLRSYAFFLKPRNLKRLWRHRQLAQASRVVRDRDFLTTFSGTIDFPQVSGFLVRWVANPIFGTYWCIVRHLIVW